MSSGVQHGFKIRALIFPVGPKFKNLPIDGYKLPLNLVTSRIV
jgi:hypothetical protein